MRSFFRGWWDREPAFLRGTERVLLRSQAVGRTATDRRNANGRIYLTTERLVWPQDGWWGTGVAWRAHTGTIEIPLSAIRAVVVDQHPPSLIILTDVEIYRVTLQWMFTVPERGLAALRVAEWRARLMSLCPDLAWGPTAPLDPRIRQFLQAERRAVKRNFLYLAAYPGAIGLGLGIAAVVVDPDIWWFAAPTLVLAPVIGAFRWLSNPPIEPE